MNKKLAVALALVLLTSCAPMVWTKPGATTADFNIDRYNCLQSSALAAPPAQGLIVIKTTAISYDANAGNRNQLFSSCMAANGWSLGRQVQQEQVQYQPAQSASVPAVPVAYNPAAAADLGSCYAKYPNANVQTVGPLLNKCMKAKGYTRVAGCTGNNAQCFH